MEKGSVIRVSEVEPFPGYCGEVYRLLRSPSGRFSVVWVEVAPGTGAKTHRHRICEEIYFVVYSTGVMWIGDENYHVDQGT